MELIPFEKPLYPVNTEPPLACDSACKRCDLHKFSPVVCMRGEGEAGGLLVIGEAPGASEAANRRLWIGESGKLLRASIKEHWNGPVAYGNAVNCLPRDEEVTEKHVEACRGYLVKLIQEAKPTRIICVGKWAFYAVTGIPINPMSARKSYAWLPQDEGEIPVLAIMHPAAALRNKFILEWWKEDLEWACKADTTCMEPHLELPFWHNGCVKLIQNARDTLQAIAHIRATKWFAFDVETAGRFYDDFRLDSLAICPEGSDSAYVWNRQVIQDKEIMEPVRDLLCDPAMKSVCHFPHENRAILNQWGKELASYWFDTGLGYRLLETNASLGLDHMANMVGMGGHKEEAEVLLKQICTRMDKAIADQSKKQAGFGFAWSEFRQKDLDAIKAGQQTRQYAYAYLPKTVGAVYVGKDAIACRKLATRFLAQFEKEPELWKTWEERRRPTTQAVVQMEEWGVPISLTAIDVAQNFLEAKLTVARQKVEAFGINPRSPSDIERFLFDEVKLKAPRTLPSGHRSTDDDSLQALKGQHPLVDGVIEFRDIDHQLSTYVLPMRARVHPDGKAHFRYNMAGTPAGRASAEGGILQLPRTKSVNPIMAQAGKLIRNFLVASPGNVILEADFKQVQIYVVACECGDEGMLEAIAAGRDIYKEASLRVAAIRKTDLSNPDIASAWRTKLKIAILATLFGQTPKSMAEDLGVSEAEAKEIVDTLLFQAWPRLGSWIESQKAYARKHGYVWGHYANQKAMRRDLSDIASHEFSRKNTAENNAINHVATNGEAEIAGHALCRLLAWLKASNLKTTLISWIHDAFLFDCPEEELAIVARKAKEVMESEPSPYHKLGLRVDLKTGYSFGSLEDYKVPDATTHASASPKAQDHTASAPSKQATAPQELLQSVSVPEPQRDPLLEAQDGQAKPSVSTDDQEPGHVDREEPEAPSSQASAVDPDIKPVHWDNKLYFVKVKPGEAPEETAARVEESYQAAIDEERKAYDLVRDDLDADILSEYRGSDEKVVAKEGEEIELAWACGHDTQHTARLDITESAYLTMLEGAARMSCLHCHNQRV